MIILIDIGTDLYPAVSLAYEEPEDMIMNIPPRKRNSHLAGKKLMITAYLILGLIETFGAYFAYFVVWYGYEFTISDLMGAGIGIRLSWNNQEEATKNFFQNMCEKSTFYQSNMISIGRNCQQDFKDFLIDVLAISQSAFLMTVVWAQVANIFVRKTQIATIFSKYRMLCNRQIYWALLSEIIIIIAVIYIPGLNKSLLLASVPFKYAISAMWIIPFIIFWEEIRKLLCRMNPKGWFAKYSTI